MLTLRQPSRAHELLAVVLRQPPHVHILLILGLAVIAFVLDVLPGLSP
jgi:hypothetical protein